VNEPDMSGPILIGLTFGMLLMMVIYNNKTFKEWKTLIWIYLWFWNFRLCFNLFAHEFHVSGLFN
jgi:hypothetical protein